MIRHKSRKKQAIAQKYLFFASKLLQSGYPFEKRGKRVIICKRGYKQSLLILISQQVIYFVSGTRCSVNRVVDLCTVGALIA